MKRIVIFLIVLFFAKPLWAVNYVAVNFGDSGDGTLRAALHGACRDPGDDEIRFAPTSQPPVIIKLTAPLEIPSGCNGVVAVIGSSTQETILDGSGIVSGEGLVIIRSWGNRIEGLSLVGNKTGAGLVLEDGDNTVRNNFMGVLRSSNTMSPNKTGLVVNSDWNVIEANTMGGNTDAGVEIGGNANTLRANRIGDCSADCSPQGVTDPAISFPSFIHEIVYEVLESQPNLGSGTGHSEVVRCGNGGDGIRITGDRNLIGGSNPEDGNRILYNGENGIQVAASGTRNSFKNNIVSYNDGGDIVVDQGGNGGVLPLVHLKTFPVDTEPADGVFRYTFFGEGVAGTNADLYVVPSDSVTTGDMCRLRYLESLEVPGGVFSNSLIGKDLTPGSWIAAVVCDSDGNCSSLSEKTALGRDSDHDGILDPVEDPTSDLIVQRDESDSLLIDTDGDGLPDSMEDKNQNGIVDSGETDSNTPDTDGDGISDYVETGGDGINNPEDGDTDPLNPDTDGDGIKDGDEDLNHNGIVEIGETDPRQSD